MNLRVRRNAAIPLLVSLAAAIVLSSGLGNLELEAGDPFPGPNGQSAENQTGAAARRVPAAEVLPAFRGILALSMLVLGVLLVERLASVTHPKHLIGLLLSITAVALLLISLPRLPAGGAIELPPEASAPPVPSADYATSPLGTPPPSFFWIGGLLVLAAAAGAGILALRPRRGALRVASQLAADASRGLEDIEAGADVKSVIIRCYLQMTTLLQTERAVIRERSMTVREFETHLEHLGLPRRPLLRLRHLFEAVRYGNRPTSGGEEHEAVDCLAEIVSSLRGGAA